MSLKSVAIFEEKNGAASFGVCLFSLKWEQEIAQAEVVRGGKNKRRQEMSQMISPNRLEKPACCYCSRKRFFVDTRRDSV